MTTTHDALFAFLAAKLGAADAEPLPITNSVVTGADCDRAAARAREAWVYAAHASRLAREWPAAAKHAATAVGYALVAEDWARSSFVKEATDARRGARLAYEDAKKLATWQENCRSEVQGEIEGAGHVVSYGGHHE